MRVHSSTDGKTPEGAKGTQYGWDIVEVVSPRSGKTYRVDVTHGRCSCPAWKFQKVGPDGVRNPCKHLLALGFKRVFSTEVVVAEPSYLDQVVAQTETL